MVLKLSNIANISGGRRGDIKTFTTPARSLLKGKEQGVWANPGTGGEGSRAVRQHRAQVRRAAGLRPGVRGPLPPRHPPRSLPAQSSSSRRAGVGPEPREAGPLPPTPTHDLEQVQSARLVHVSPMCLSREGARRADLSGPGGCLGRPGGPPRPFPLVFRQQREKMEAGEEPGPGEQGVGSPAPGKESGWHSAREEGGGGGGDLGRRERRGEAPGGGGADGRSSAPGGSQRKAKAKAKARRCRYLCRRRSERRRGRRALQHVHPQLLRHRRRRRGRRLGHVALDHWRRVGSGSLLRPLAAGPLLPPRPAPSRPGLAPRSSPAGRQRAGRGWAIGKSDARGSREVAAERGASAIGRAGLSAPRAAARGPSSPRGRARAGGERPRGRRVGKRE